MTKFSPQINNPPIKRLDTEANMNAALPFLATGISLRLVEARHPRFSDCLPTLLDDKIAQSQTQAATLATSIYISQKHSKMPMSHLFSRKKPRSQGTENPTLHGGSSSVQVPASTPTRHNRDEQQPSAVTQILGNTADMALAVPAPEAIAGRATVHPLWLAQMQPSTASASRQSSERDGLTMVPYNRVEAQALALSSHQPQQGRRNRSDLSPLSRATEAVDSRLRLRDQASPPKMRKILSLDGGGVRGLSIILILKHLMHNLNRKRGVPVQPWEEFDMIGGTSTGGIIAIMLGRLHMSLDECEMAYKEMSRKIFTSTTRHFPDPRRMYDYLCADAKFKAKPLEDTVRDVLRAKNMVEDELLKDTDKDLCRVFVCTTRGYNGSPVILRSYDSSKINPYYHDCTVWRSVRATSAASTFFDPIKLGPHDEPFVDGQFVCYALA